MSELMLIPQHKVGDLRQILTNKNTNIGLPGRALSAARRMAGLRQAELAEQGGFSVSMLKLLEREGAMHFAPYNNSLTSYVKVLDSYGVRLLLGANEVTVKQRIV